MERKKGSIFIAAALIAVIIFSAFANWKIGYIRDELGISGKGPFAIGTIWWIIPAIAVLLLIVVLISAAKTGRAQAITNLICILFFVGVLAIGGSFISYVSSEYGTEVKQQDIEIDQQEASDAGLNFQGQVLQALHGNF